MPVCTRLAFSGAGPLSVQMHVMQSCIGGYLLHDGSAAPQSPSLDVAKKDDDLWSPRHAHVAGAHAPAALASEAAFLSHFLPAPGNHPPSIYHPSTTTLRADLNRHRLAGWGAPSRPCACNGPTLLAKRVQ